MNTKEYTKNKFGLLVFSLIFSLVFAMFCFVGCGPNNQGDDEEIPTFPEDENAPAYTIDGDYVYFGSYAQTLKAQDVTVSKYPSVEGYYKGSDGEKYVKRTAKVTVEMPSTETGEEEANAEEAGDDTTTEEKTYLFEADKDYYFKVESIKWRILSQENGELLLYCVTAIDIVNYQNYGAFEVNADDGKYYLLESDTIPSGTNGNNYEFSYVRSWLNNDFFNAAFNTKQKAVMLQTEVDNSTATGATSGCECQNTNDYVFLLSRNEYANTDYGFSNDRDWVASTTRQFVLSDYAQSVVSGGSKNVSVWTRSPTNPRGYYSNVYGIMSDGQFNSYFNMVGDNGVGVCPVVKIQTQQS